MTAYYFSTVLLPEQADQLTELCDAAAKALDQSTTVYSPRVSAESGRVQVGFHIDADSESDAHGVGVRELHHLLSTSVPVGDAVEMTPPFLDTLGRVT